MSVTHVKNDDRLDGSLVEAAPAAPAPRPSSTEPSDAPHRVHVLVDVDAGGEGFAAGFGKTGERQPLCCGYFTFARQ